MMCVPVGLSPGPLHAPTAASATLLRPSTVTEDYLASDSTQGADLKQQCVF